MVNPFDVLESRLCSVENLLIEVKCTLLKQPQEIVEPRIVDLAGLLEHRPIVGSKSSIYKMVMNGEIPHSKRGKKLYFELTEIDEWLMGNKRSTVDQEVQETIEYMQKKSA